MMDIRSRLKTLHELDNAFYRNIINEFLEPAIIELYLKAKGRLGYEKSLWFGDADVYVNVERLNDEYDLLILRNVVTCFENNNIVIWIDCELNIKRIVALNDIEVKSEYSRRHRFGDHRDWDKVSIDTFRNNEWKFGYDDLRDKFHVYTVGIFGKIGSRPCEYSCGFNRFNLEYVMHEVQYAYASVVENESYTVD